MIRFLIIAHVLLYIEDLIYNQIGTARYNYNTFVLKR